MNIERFKACVKGNGLDIKKMRNLETLRISQKGKPIMDVWYSDVFPIVSFREWYNEKLAPKLVPARRR